MGKVSVIIPAYNCARYLSSAIESVLAQSYRDFEIVVVDDGSTDDTESVLRRFAASIRLLNTCHQGPAAARNRGIKASDGEYVAFLDADDWWVPQKLDEQLAEFEKDTAAGLVFSDLEVLSDDGMVTPSFLSSRPLAASGYVFDQYLRSRFILTSSVLVRRKCLERVGLFDESMLSLEDCELLLRLCYEYKVALVSKALVHRRQRAGNLTSNEELGTQYAMRFYGEALALPALSPGRIREVHRQLSVACFKRGAYCLSQRRMDECRSSLRSSLKHDWSNRSAVQTLIGSYVPEGWLKRLRCWKSWLKTGNLNAGKLCSGVSAAGAPELTAGAIRNGKTGRA
jgi:hypothetical protein